MSPSGISQEAAICGSCGQDVCAVLCLLLVAEMFRKQQECVEYSVSHIWARKQPS